MQCSDWSERPLLEEQITYAGIDAWILTRLFDSLIHTSEIGKKGNMELQKSIRSLCKEYQVTLPEPIKNFLVRTDVPEDDVLTMKKMNENEMKDKNKDKAKNEEERDTDREKGKERGISVGAATKTMRSSLPLNAMKVKELNMSKQWTPTGLVL